jgi:hypothetical protein
MATVKLFNALAPVPTPPALPTETQLSTAKKELANSKRGDGHPIPPPFTYGKIYSARGKPVDKMAKAPRLSRVELQKLMLDLLKPDTQLQLLSTDGLRVGPQSTKQTSFFGLARASMAKKRTRAVRQRIGKRLNLKSMVLKTKKYKMQNKYKLLVEISTNVTGKHTIFYSSKMTQQDTTHGPVTHDQTQQSKLGLQQNFTYPTIARKSRTPPYSEARDPSNQEWTNVSDTLHKWLDSHFHSGNELALPNPLYPNNAAFDTILKISDFKWMFLPRTLNNLTGKAPPFKFYITNNWTNPKDTNLYILLKVRLTGRVRKGHKINHKQAVPVVKVSKGKSGKLKKASSFCSNQLTQFKNIAIDRYHSSPGLLTDSTSEKFEKKMTRAEKANKIANNIKLYYENEKKALDYWEQEYYCRQSINFNAGVDGNWPNIIPTQSRFPFDPWTLQPAVATTYILTQYPNGLPGSRLAPNGQSSNNRPTPQIGLLRPVWPLPFSPFGMSLKPRMVLILFNRINSFINVPSGGEGVILTAAIPAFGAATALQRILVQGKLPRLTTLPPNQWRNLFILYEYVLYNRFDVNDPELILEPYEPYPTLPQPVAPSEFGTWLIKPNKRQYAIPINTGVIPWTSALAIPPAGNILPTPLLGQASRPRVSWQQVKKNGFYQIEAKKWATWMVLANPFPIPGFLEYSDYILLLQKYKYTKLSARSVVPLPGTALTNPQNNTQLGLPTTNRQFISGFRNEGAALGAWILPSNDARTTQYINPYAAQAPGFANLRRTAPTIEQWVFCGPKAGQYPEQIWPKNNMRVNGAPLVFPKLETLSTVYTHRSKMKDLAGWKGGRRTMRKYRRKRKSKTLKRRKKK